MENQRNYTNKVLLLPLREFNEEVVRAMLALYCAELPGAIQELEEAQRVTGDVLNLEFTV